MVTGAASWLTTEAHGTVACCAGRLGSGTVDGDDRFLFGLAIGGNSVIGMMLGRTLCVDGAAGV